MTLMGQAHGLRLVNEGRWEGESVQLFELTGD
jgi:hypothetical protein